MLHGNVLLSQKLHEQALTPLHAEAETEAAAACVGSEGTHNHGSWCGDSYRAGDDEGPRTVRGDEEKGWKKILRQLLSQGQERLDSGEFPRDLQPAGNFPAEDGMQGTAPQAKHVDPSSLHPGFAYKTRPELHIADHPEVPHMKVPQPSTTITPSVSGRFQGGAECLSSGLCDST